jgi:DNA gyrase subunit B
MADYKASDIVVLRGLECVRRRPGMYIGDVEDGSGMHYLLRGVIDRAFSENMDGTASFIRVQIEDDVVIVEDDGTGMPVAPLRREPEMSELEAAFTLLFSGGSPHGRRWADCTLAVANALSAWMEVTVWREGRMYQQRHERGMPCAPVSDVGPATRSGTRIVFAPDFTIFRRLPWDRDAIASRLRELAALGRNLTTVLQHQIFRAPDGLADLARHLAGDANPIGTGPIRLRGVLHDVDVAVALLWTDAPASITAGFVNGQPMPLGTHLRGLDAGVRMVLRGMAGERLRRVRRGAIDELFEGGRVALVHVVMDRARTAGATGSELASPEAYDAVRALLTVGLGPELDRDRELERSLRARLPAERPARRFGS